jgi:hypothetical protein
METIVLRKDSEWIQIDKELCRVIDFVPSASIQNGRVMTSDNTAPYASIQLECRKMPDKKIEGFITNKTDFIHLWAAFNERGIKQDEEVIVSWTRNNYKNFVYKLFSAFMPKLWVMVCPRDAFKIMNFSDFRPDLSGEARYLAKAPIVEWKPGIME